MMNHMVSMVGPMTEMGSGMQGGRTMSDGMGMIRQARALGDSLEPSLGRALGIGRPPRDRPLG